MEFSEQEVTMALPDCCGNKAPRPNSITMPFFQTNCVTLVLRANSSSDFFDFEKKVREFAKMIVATLGS